MPSGVKKIAQVAVGAVIGFVQGGPVGAAIGAGLAFYAASQQEKLSTNSPLRDNEPSAQTVRSSKAPIRFILGRVSTGGVLVWAQEQSGTATEGELLHLVYVLCEGAVDGIENIYLGEEEISTYGEFASYELIVNPTEVNPFLKANCPDWKDSQIGRGLSFLRITLKYSAEKFPSGIPEMRAVVRGRNDIYDPRTGNNIYTTNTALHILWFLRNRCNVPDDEIIFETFASAANVCDEALTNADGSVSQRYRTSCVIGADEQRPGVLQKLEASCAGKLIRVGGRWMLQAGAYYGPYDFEITEDMIVGTVVGSSESTNDSAINTVRGTFIDPEQSWTETDYPEVSVSEWILEDGGEAAETMTFPYVDDAYQPQRLANIALRQRRAGGAISLPMNFSGYNCRPGRVVLVNLPSLNIFGEFIVSDWSMGDNEGCTVQVKQYEAAIFDDAVGQPYNPLGFINLPSGGLGSPTGLAWAAGDVAEVVQGVLSWVPPQGIVTSYVVTVRQGGNAVQSRSVPATANTLAINGLPSGAYTMSVAALGPMARSGEATISVGIQGPPIPESCVVQSSLDSIVLIPQNPNHALNGGTYEYFFSTNPKATSGTAEYLGQGLSFTHNSLAFYTNYYYFIRSSNAYGKSAFLYVPASTSNDISAYLAAFAGKITETELGQEVLETIKLIDGDGPGSVNDRLAAAKSALAEQISDVDDALGTVRAELQQQIDSIADLADSMPYKPGDTYSAGQGVLGADGIIYQATQNVPVNTPPPNSTYWLNVGQAVATAVGLASRVQTVETKVTSIEGVSSAQAKQITGLQSSLDGKASASSVQSLGNRVTDAEGKLSSQGSAITGINTELAGKASSATVQALGNTVTQQGQDIKAQGQAITSVTASLGNSGGQNLFFNPAFTKESAVAGVAEGWQVDVGTGGTHIASLVPSWLVSTEKAQRIDVSDLNQAAGYRSIRIVSASYRPKVTAGNSVVASCNVRATAGLVFAVFIQGVNAAGTDAVTVSGPRVVATGGTQRLVYDFPNLPAGTASVQVYFRLYGSDAVSAGFAEYTRAQLEIGTTVSGWKDNNAVLGIEQSATSSAVAALSSSVSQQGATIIAQASSMQALQASSRDDNGDGDLADAVNGYNSAAGIVQEATVRASQNEATARTVTQLTASVGANTGQITDLREVVTSNLASTATAITQLTTRVGDNSAAIQSEATARSNADGALSSQISTAQATANGATAQAQTASTAVSGLNGKVSALTTIKTSTTVGGRTVMAGLAIGVEGQQQEAQILAYAQRFAILDESSGTLIAPFVVQGGKVIIDSAMIGNASIGVAQLTQSLQSSNYIAGQQGLKINFLTGEFEFNSATGDGGRQTINNAGGKVFDQNGVKRYQWGNLAV
ncbi:host specificity protein J [Pseudomonas syringae pv. japonica str. M301072]|uniref:Host specificity protein J n=1 Tax=Pseudomonas syringae pv. japonica str. M301072 TaxID=629262 RepID=F3FBU6_PSESX|nr:host specificity protein J [Pseudomonas syringae pv. japonica str. M301072]